MQLRKIKRPSSRRDTSIIVGKLFMCDVCGGLHPKGACRKGHRNGFRPGRGPELLRGSTMM